MYEVYHSNCKRPVKTYRTVRGLKHHLAHLAKDSALTYVSVKCTLQEQVSWVAVKLYRNDRGWGWDAGDTGIPVRPGYTLHSIRRAPELDGKL